MSFGAGRQEHQRNVGSFRTPATVAALGLMVAAGQIATPTGATPAGAAPPSTQVPRSAGHAANPYAGGTGYVNPLWKARADAEPGGYRISNTPTAVWLETIASVEGGGSPGSMGLAAHLDAALAQDATYAQFVLHDLPARDCDRSASSTDLGPDEIDRYRSGFIDPIATIMSDPRYADLKIVTIVEPNSLPRLITNTGTRARATEACNTVQANGAYVAGVRYALDKLHAIANVYTYLDIAHHGALGWSQDFGSVANLIATTVGGTAAGMASVDGFVANTATYGVHTEPYLKITATVNGVSVKQSKWVDWNDYVDELTYAMAFRTRLVSLGFASDVGLLFDTSRNGWGGPARPTKVSTSTDLNTYVDASRVDRRPIQEGWCNQKGAGLGERPTASPTSDIDAYVWVKAPGESDGAADEMGGDGLRWCHPVLWSGGNDHPSGALADAPVRGAWFSTQFQELMRNAYPPLEPPAA
jgi:cellulose 1,4-beta-cellobiosidase